MLGAYGCLDSASDTENPAGADEDSDQIPTGDTQTSTNGSQTATTTTTLTDTVDPDGDPNGDGTTQGCHGIDFLVIVDQSGSMDDEQINLAASFPGFLTTLQAAVSETATTFHVMVVDTDSDSCEALCDAGGQACLQNGEPILCKDWVKPDANDCNSMLGAARITDGAGTLCGIQGEQRFIISDQQENLDSVFSCLGRQGTKGSGAEKPIQAMANALSPALLAPEGCNAGFLRRDAMLVMMVISDEDDDRVQASEPGSDLEPRDWYQAALAAKHGDPGAVMAVGLIGDRDLPDPVCMELEGTTGADASPRLREFFSYFGRRGVTGSVCADNYTPFLDQLVAHIDMNCDDWIPPE
jgi:hypothetical protein